MPMISYSIDLAAIKSLKSDFRFNLRVGVRETAERGVELIRAEVPERSQRLKRGVSYDMSPTSARSLKAEIVVSAVRPAESAGVATLHLPSGKTKEVAVRSQKAYDYARDVAEGTGLYGVRGQYIEPKRSRVLRIPVDTVEAGEAYLTVGGQKYILRPRSKGQPANRYDERAWSRLLLEAPGIVERQLAPLASVRGARV